VTELRIFEVFKGAVDACDPQASSLVALRQRRESRIPTFERVTLNVREAKSLECHQIVTKDRAKGAKTEQIQKTQIVAILQLAKGFS